MKLFEVTEQFDKLQRNLIKFKTKCTFYLHDVSVMDLLVFLEIFLLEAQRIDYGYDC